MRPRGVHKLCPPAYFVTRDLTNPDFWNQHWRESGQGNIQRSGYEARVWDTIYQQVFSSARPGQRCIEIGCGNSEHLAVIGRRYRLEVAGMDYAAAGCQLCRQRLEHSGVPGIVYQRDLFGPNDDLAGQFDYVMSFGVVEHFDDPRFALQQMRNLLRPGGRILTTIPNVDPRSLNVRIYRRVAPRILATHKLMRLEDLRQFHEAAGFKTRCAEFMGAGLCLALDDPRDWRARWLRALGYRSVQFSRRGLEVLGLRVPSGWFTGLYMLYLGQKLP